MSHNLEVIESVCKEVDIKAPKALTCSIHPLMMMQRKVKELFRLIHKKIGYDKVKECFLTDIVLANEDFIIRAITCLSNFIKKDYTAKTWNRQSHFDHFIYYVKDFRFNRIINRSFLEMPIPKPIFCAVALVGIQIT